MLLARLPSVDFILFDIDGTLTQSQSIDGEIYLHSLAEVFGFTDVGSDWSAYRHTTDAGILHEFFEDRLGRVPAPAELSAFRTHFVDAIAVAAAHMPFHEIDGASQVLRYLAESPSHGVSLATGGWRNSAPCKMRSAGMDYDAFPAASAEDAISRVSIMQIAHRSSYSSCRWTSPRHHCVCWRWHLGCSRLPTTKSTIRRDRGRSSRGNTAGRRSPGGIFGLLRYRRMLYCAGSRSRTNLAAVQYRNSGVESCAIAPNIARKELLERKGNLTTHMDVRDNSPYLRQAVLIVILLLYGSLIVFLLRTKPARPASVLLSTIFFVNPEPVLRFHRLRLL
jgi:hypothetical protein